MSYFPRTDLAAEAHSLWRNSTDKNTALHGVEAHEETLHGFSVTEVNILNAEGERVLGKARGRYYSLALPRDIEHGGSIENAAAVLKELILRLLPVSAQSVLVAALGNPDITPDALGNLAASRLLVTRHLKAGVSPLFDSFASLSVCRPFVLGTSGIESAVQVTELCRAVKPDAVIVIDALAGCEPDSLGLTVQVSDAGISPGSGVGNDRKELSRSVLGVPVVSVGVPTVIDAGIFGGDTLSGMFVTPRSVDVLVRRTAMLIAAGVNLAVHRKLSYAEMSELAER